jgi:hypothetical protein
MQDLDLGVFVARHQGLKIYQSEDGFSACNGSDFAADNAETLEGAKGQIEDYWADAQAFYGKA